MSKPREEVPVASSTGEKSVERRTPMGIEPSYDFASDDAAELWQAQGRPVLTSGPSGKNGYTVADVKAALSEE